MKITLTLAEVKALVCSRYHFDEDSVTVEVIASLATPTMTEKILKALRNGPVYNQCPCIDGNDKVIPERKILAIKALREATEMGLADAKYAIENFERFIAYVRNGGDLLKFK